MRCARRSRSRAKKSTSLCETRHGGEACAFSTKINARGQVEGTCVGTTFASDPVYYYNRPASVDALHGYGPTLLAGAEMIRLLKNPAVDIQVKLRTYHYVPKDGGTTKYQE